MVRTLFVGLISKYPFSSKYLASDSDIVHLPTFEKALVRVQRRDENELDDQE